MISLFFSLLYLGKALVTNHIASTKGEREELRELGDKIDVLNLDLKGGKL